MKWLSMLTERSGIRNTVDKAVFNFIMVCLGKNTIKGAANWLFEYFDSEAEFEDL